MLTLWTEDPVLARCADAAGIDRIGLDLETTSNRERQSGLGTWISSHRLKNLPDVRGSLRNAEQLARVNPLGPTTSDEVDRLTAMGVEVLMLPMFESMRFGFGGIGRVEDDGLPIRSDLIYPRYPRLGATAALISRAHLRPGATALELREEVSSRERLARWHAASSGELGAAHREFHVALARCDTC